MNQHILPKTKTIAKLKIKPIGSLSGNDWVASIESTLLKVTIASTLSYYR